MREKKFIRNFCIIAHIDHGKSTLADRMLQLTGAISDREFKDQLLDDMELERERGITIKSSAVRLDYRAEDGQTYCLNLIDTPGHVDFTSEVSKSLAACEGVLLVVDAAQGVEAQTVANLYMALEHNLVIIPVINKIDLANAEPEKVSRQIKDILNLGNTKMICASAKKGTGTREILERIVSDIPPPTGNSDSPLQALIFDSKFDSYKGVIIYVRMANGSLGQGQKIKMMRDGGVYEVQEIGIFKPKPTEVGELGCGEVGYFTCNIREASGVGIGDTVTSATHPAVQPLPGYKKFRPMVFCGMYPVNSKDFPALRQAMEKLKLSDSAFVHEPESSASFGQGFRCGFLGLLHMEIVQERLEREYDLNLIISTPSVVYHVLNNKGQILEIDNPTKLPSEGEIEEIEEPFVLAHLIIPSSSIGAIMELAESKRGEYKSTEYLGPEKARLVYELPLSEIIVDFYDKIKSKTHGYGSLDYEFLGYQPSKLVRLDILLNGKLCDALSSIIHQDKAPIKGRALVEKLKKLIPKQLVEVTIQAAIGSRILSRADVSPLRKNVTGKCYGGDITRKRKLWEKQKAGKKRMKRWGKVQIPQEAFIAALKT